MIMRVLLFAIEDMHLQLSKLVPGSTIGVGGEEKKLRISTSMQAAILTNPRIDVPSTNYSGRTEME